MYGCPCLCVVVLVHIRLSLSVYGCPCACTVVPTHVRLSLSMYGCPCPCTVVPVYVWLSLCMYGCPYPCTVVPVHAIQGEGGEDAQFNSFSALDGGTWSTSSSGRFTTVTEPRQPLNSSLMGPKASLDMSERRKLTSSYHDSNLGPSNPLPGPHNDCAITVVDKTFPV